MRIWVSIAKSISNKTVIKHIFLQEIQWVRKIKAKEYKKLMPLNTSDIQGHFKTFKFLYKQIKFPFKLRPIPLQNRCYRIFFKTPWPLPCQIYWTFVPHKSPSPISTFTLAFNTEKFWLFSLPQWQFSKDSRMLSAHTYRFPVYYTYTY